MCGPVVACATRIADRCKLEGAGWVTALKAPDIAALAADGRPLQMSLFDTQNFAEITHPVILAYETGLVRVGWGAISADFAKRIGP